MIVPSIDQIYSDIIDDNVLIIQILYIIDNTGQRQRTIAVRVLFNYNLTSPILPNPNHQSVISQWYNLHISAYSLLHLSVSTLVKSIKSIDSISYLSVILLHLPVTYSHLHSPTAKSVSQLSNVSI